MARPSTELTLSRTPAEVSSGSRPKGLPVEWHCVQVRRKTWSRTSGQWTTWLSGFVLGPGEGKGEGTLEGSGDGTDEGSGDGVSDGSFFGISPSGAPASSQALRIAMGSA